MQKVKIWIVWTLTIYKIYNNILDISFLLWINHFWFERFQNQFLSFWRFAKNLFSVHRPSNRLRLCWKSGNSRITRKWSSLRKRKSQKIYVPVLTVIGSFHVQSLDSFKNESEILESRPKESGKSCHLKFQENFKFWSNYRPRFLNKWRKISRKLDFLWKFW